MHTLEIILAFILLLTSMFMAYPQRAKTATKCLTSLMAAMPISKLFETLIKYFNRENK